MILAKIMFISSYMMMPKKKKKPRHDFQYIYIIKHLNVCAQMLQLVLYF